ncbi:hypothetical protein G9A89_016980 [Geosiphon pyriformis]|nr:hypothetical protein G9A89_016980 [Geosiphon pyriformis]
MSANAGMLSDEFDTAVKHSDLDVMWDVLCKIMMLSVNKIFRKKWFKNFDSVFTKVSLKFHRLKLLVLKIIKAFHEESDLINSNYVHSVLSGIRKSYCASKLAEFLAAREANIRSAIDRRMESFETNKDHTIRSVLKHFFCKVVLNHLVVNDKLISEPGLVKSKPLDYVFDKVFSGIMYSVEFSKLLDVVSILSDDKTVGLLGITNELWKHCDKSILDMLLVLLNLSLSCKSVPGSWKETWVLMIPKPYKWEGVLMNTCPIALIGMALGADSLSIYTDGSLSNLGLVGYRTGVVAFFENVDLGLGVSVSGLMSSTLVELQTIALALECVFFLCSVNLFSDSQSALNACHSGVSGNECTDTIAGDAFLYNWYLSSRLVAGLASGLSAGVVKLLGIANAFGVCFGFCKSLLPEVFWSLFLNVVDVDLL